MRSELTKIHFLFCTTTIMDDLREIGKICRKLENLWRNLQKKSKKLHCTASRAKMKSIYWHQSWLTYTFYSAQKLTTSGKLVKIAGNLRISVETYKKSPKTFTASRAKINCLNPNWHDLKSYTKAWGRGKNAQSACPLKFY